MIADPRATWGVTCGNPIWAEVLAVAQRTAPTFLLNVSLNRDRQITGVFAGIWCWLTRPGSILSGHGPCKPVPGPFDIVVTSNSGYPLDLNLYQASKACRQQP